MQRFLVYLIQPGVVATGLWGTFLQVGLASANSFYVAGGPTRSRTALRVSSPRAA